MTGPLAAAAQAYRAAFGRDPPLLSRLRPEQRAGLAEVIALAVTNRRRLSKRDLLRVARRKPAGAVA